MMMINAEDGVSSSEEGYRPVTNTLASVVCHMEYAD